VLNGITPAPPQTFAHLVIADGENKKGIKMVWMLFCGRSVKLDFIKITFFENYGGLKMHQKYPDFASKLFHQIISKCCYNYSLFLQVSQFLFLLWSTYFPANKFYFKVLSKHLPEGTKKGHNKFNQNGQSPDSDLNLRTSEYKAKC
jgi:hypothetical protein